MSSITTGAYLGNFGVALMLTVGQECCPVTEIDVGRLSEIRAATFTVNGEYIVGGGPGNGLGVWRVQDGKQMAMLAAKDVHCVAVSQDGKRIAAGTDSGEVFVWNAEAFEQVFFFRKEDIYCQITGVDFSPDSTRLVTTLWNGTTTVWDVAARKKVRTLDHEGYVRAAKYSPQGDRIAIATDKSVQVWDSDDGHLLVHIPVEVTPWYNTGLLWSNNHLFVVSYGRIKQFEASTGSAVSEWPVPDPFFTNVYPCIALPRHGKFIAHSAKDILTVWDTSTQAQLSLIKHTRSIRAIAFSPDDQFLAIGANTKKIVIKDLRDVSPTSYSTVSIVYRGIIAYQNGSTANPFWASVRHAD